MIETILFDLDGTILDTNELILVSFEHTFKEHQLEAFSRERIIEQMGKPLKEQMVLFSGKTEVDDIIQTYRSFNLRKHDEMVRLFPHVKEVLAALHEHGIRLGIVTSKLKLNVGRALELFDVEKYFSTIVTPEDVSFPKPHPESVQVALSRLEADPRNALMVGDSQYDLLAAHGSGVRSAGVAWSLQGEAILRKLDPAYMLGDIRDLLAIVADERIRNQ